VGGRVDYGAAHSKKHSHERFGKTYASGFVEDWGANKPISLVGHSMGGQTIRMLEILLNEGSAEEVTESGADVSPLFHGGKKGWVRSLTTIATPHDGSTAVNVLGDNFVLLIKNILLAFGALTEDSVIESIYDFDLEHHGLARLEGESKHEYNERVFASPIWSNTYTDFADYDLSLEGAAKMNAMGKQAYPETTYFAFVCDQTYRGLWPFHRNYYPIPIMMFFLQPFALMIGGFKGKGIEWRENDGLVPVISQTCPKQGAQNPARNCLNRVPSSGQPEKGKWHQTTVGRDHVQVIGLSLVYNNNGIFQDLANQIASAGGQPSQRSEIAEEDLVELNPEYGMAPNTISAPSALVIGLATVGGLATVAVGVVMMKVMKSRRQAKPSAVVTTTPSFTMESPSNKEGVFNPQYDL
jgi:triacylglycerol lipase